MTKKIENYNNLIKLQEDLNRRFRKKCLKHLKRLILGAIKTGDFFVLSDPDGQPRFEFSLVHVKAIDLRKVSSFHNMSSKDLLKIIKLLEEITGDKN